MIFFENFDRLCKEHKIAPSRVCQDIGASTGNVKKWKNGSIPNGALLSKIANYFNVSVDKLLSVDKKIPPLDYSNEDISLFNDIKRLTTEQQALLRALVDSYKGK